MDKETIKRFLKPDKWKVVVFILFVLINIALIYLHISNPLSFILPEPGQYIEEYGLPFVFLTVITEGITLISPKVSKTISVNYYGLFIDILVWWLLSCLVISAYNKFRKK
ncbi:hypothetical protein J7K42_00435 [bacterium]|nr:hypothetical protein [bacterium]